MFRFPLKWLVPRLGVLLILVFFIQLVAYMGVVSKNCPLTKTIIKEVIREREIKMNCTVLQKAAAEPDHDIKNKLCKEQKYLVIKLKKLINDLIETQKDLVTLAPIYHRVGQHIKSVNGLLRSIQEQEVVVNKKEVLKTKTKPQRNVVCPERFMGTDLSYGYPWFRKGFTTLNCTNRVPLHKLITLVLYYNFFPPSHSLYTILQHIATFYPAMNVILSSGNNQIYFNKKALESRLNISLTIKPFHDKNQGHIWNTLLHNVRTPYVYLGTNISHFTDDVNLERLIRVISTNKEIVIAGGGHRNQRGEWSLGCSQTVFRNWTMYFQGGYYHSYGDCVLCDHVEGPWVAETNKLKNLGFDRSLRYGVFHDLLFRLKKMMPDSLAVTCPDVMFNIYSSPVDDSSYVQLAKKWDIKKWVEEDGRVRWYGCRRGYQHNSGSSTCSLTKGLANPPCELENLADAIKFIMRECENAGLFCELQEGTLLGAVKFNKVLPWERDADITFLTANYTAFKKLKPKFIAQGYTLTDDDPSLWCCVDGRQAGGKFRVGTPGFTIEMYGQHMMESELLTASGQSPTKILFAGQWVTVVRNPGLYARNRYGPNHFKHSEHWMDLGHSTGWSYYNPSQFSPCPSPGHSACLDQYPADGNIQFSDYTIR